MLLNDFVIDKNIYLYSNYKIFLFTIYKYCNNFYLENILRIQKIKKLKFKSNYKKFYFIGIYSKRYIIYRFIFLKLK
ncbi:hypothetical protein HMPREF9220_0025 [Dialister micraerophilus UPII 345-E]|uniref:Uncharacterized protein n=1 Tax=Dialister micraerophilus UPII 345-E TaxID=910314 RepID=E4L7M0_9FIRM|nr:hypothetical protein HMPREF9220_0025 [Dialister micraerophilus UPII 345-E]